MAGVLKARDTDGSVRTISAVKVRDTDGSVRTLAFIRVRDTDGTLREVFTAGGGTPAANPTFITPGSRNLAGKGPTKSATFTASSSSGTPTSYAWGLYDGDGSVIAGANAATATLQVYSDGSFTESTFYCDMVIGGTTFRAFCSFYYTQTATGSLL